SFSDVNEAGEDYIPGIRNIKIRVDGQIVTPQPRWTVVLNAPQEEITDKLQQAGWTVEQLIAALSDGEFSPPADHRRCRRNGLRIISRSLLSS
ncbi:hypothetical protein LMF94_23170, partial [Salmonella enterica subsp. enterica serovar Muenster]|nr:hypothetical protein [Salmonella enterica subsp. enterica serovar Muenster]